MVNKVLLGVLGVVVASQAMVLTEISVTDENSVKGTSSYGNYVYTAYSVAAQVGLYSVVDPVNPVLLKKFGEPTDVPYKVEVVGTILYVRNSNGVDTWSLADPENPVRVSSYTYTGCNAFEWGSVDLSFSGDYLYTVCEQKMFTLLTDSSGTLTHVTDRSIPGPTFSIDFLLISGTKLFVMHGNAAITTIDVTNPANPVVGAHRQYSGGTSNYQLFVGGKSVNGELYVVGQNPVFRKIDTTTLNVIPITLPSEISTLANSAAIDVEAPYVYISNYFGGSNALNVIEEASNVFTFVEKHDGRNGQDIEVMGGQVIAVSPSNKWYIYTAPSLCSVEGPMVVINEQVLAGVDLAGATTYKSGSKQLERIPTNLRSMQVHMPETDVLAGSLIELSCCGASGSVCEFVLSHYHCPPCSGAVNGAFPKVLPVQGFEAGSCAPKYGATEERMTSYRVQVQPGEKITVGPTTVDATSFAIFSQQGAFAEAWCPAKDGKVGCGGPCLPNVCKCLN